MLPDSFLEKDKKYLKENSLSTEEIIGKAGLIIDAENFKEKLK